MAAVSHQNSFYLSASALTLVVHVVFFLMLFFSFGWQMKPPQGVVVELWDSLPNERSVPVEVAQPPKVEQHIEPAAKPKIEHAPVAQHKPEISVKDKKAKQEKQASDRSKEQQKAEKMAEMAERRMEMLERMEKEKAIARRKSEEQAAIAAGRMVDEYIGRIAARVRRNIVNPPGVAQNIRAEFNVTLLPSGEVLNATLARSSGNDVYDRAVERAILKSSPLPLPPAEKNLFTRFRELRLKFSPSESMQ